MAKKDQNDPETTVLFKEIDEELRQDKATALWKQYGPTFIAAIVALILGVAGFEGWKYYDFSNRSALGEQYQAGLDALDNNQVSEAASIFSELAADKDGYGVLSSFQEAALQAQQGQFDKAAETYFMLSRHEDVDETFQNIALLMGAMNGLNSMDENDLISRLDGLASGASPWRHSALELQAYAHAQSGNETKAAEILNGLINDATAPGGVRQRAQEFVQVYGG